MYKKNDRNKEGYKDTTPEKVMKQVDKEEERFNKLLRTIFYICDLAGFRVEGRITLVDKKTRRVWK